MLIAAPYDAGIEACRDSSAGREPRNDARDEVLLHDHDHDQLDDDEEDEA